ncbi:MAG: class I SAM-dependent methyltransferase [Candidatus Shapirobacteria bacterium]|nr:class I SAM-dependent methyltransferase [Candidatus Shapirobacteria bacterium]
MNKIRKCPLCGNKICSLVYNQKYTSHFNHKIVCCKKCNFIFVGNIPPKKYYEEYYKNESKYEGVREHEAHENQAIRELLCFVKKYVSKKSRILDIGCSIGYLLSVLKSEGYKNLLGVEPAPKCKKIAKEKYGLKVETTNLSNFSTSIKYDLIIFSMVLEHLVDIKKSINKIKCLLNEGGYLYISVPNTSSFYLNTIEPFGEFSTEHINFFTESSLFFLMRGFTNILMKSANNGLHSIWQNGDAGVRSIKKYIDLSDSKLKKIQKKIDSLSEKVIVWGAGALSQRLLSTTNIKDKILFFVDSNPKLQGAKLGKIPIYSPDVIIDNKFPILVSSYNFSKEIVKNIRIKKYSNKILTF